MRKYNRAIFGVLTMVAFAVVASPASAAVHDILDCSDQWVAETSEADELYHPGYGKYPDFETWSENMLAAFQRATQCVLDKISVADDSTSFQFARDGAVGRPTASTWQFANTYAANATIYITVANGELDGGTVRATNAQIKINGTVVADVSDFAGSDGFRKAVTLQSGTNAIEISIPSTEAGVIWVLLDDDQYSYPGEQL